MADKSVGELISAQSVTPTDMFVLEQNGTAKKLTGQVLENWLVSFADGHGGIQSIKKLSTSGLVDTYRITLADTTTFDFVVTNGRGITGISKTSTSGLMDTYTISYNNGTTSKFTVTNGAKGDKGDNSYVWIKYASQEPTESSNSMGDIPDDWIGIYSGNASTAPTDWKQYKWYKIKGEKGDIGIPATLVSTEIVYQSSGSGTIIPSGAWSASIPVVAQGKYLWKRTTRKFNSGEPEVSYDVNRMGIDGSGSVSSVAGVSPDTTGNVTLTAADVGALAVSGGDVTGAINMNGQPISGLNDPTEESQAARKGYVDNAVRKAAPRNLLDNSDFTNLVAQAGFGGKHGSATFLADRWRITGESVVLDVGKRVLSFGGGKLQYIEQRLSPEAAWKRVTFAVKAHSVSGRTNLSEVDAKSGHNDVTIKDGVTLHTFVCGSNTGVRLWSDSPSSLVIDWVALYEGEYTAETLPEYQPKGYGAELAECQRYYLQFSGLEPVAVGYGYSANGVLVVVAIPAMRARASVVISGTIYMRKNDQLINASGVENYGQSKNSAQLYFTSSAVTAGAPYDIYCAEGAKLALIADL